MSPDTVFSDLGRRRAGQSSQDFLLSKWGKIYTHQFHTHSIQEHLESWPCAALGGLTNAQKKSKLNIVWQLPVLATYIDIADIFHPLPVFLLSLWFNKDK